MIDRRSTFAALSALAGAVACGSPFALSPEDAGHDAAEIAPSARETFADCGRCHAAIARDHAESMHARAYDDPLFQREWSVGRSEWCVGCHAPSATDAADPRVHDGIGCASCHVADGEIVATEISGRAPHPSRVDPDLASPERCARCHEFDFQRGHEQLQRTLSEWRTTGRSETCAGCHMPEGSHRVRGPRDPELLAHALDVGVTALRRGRDVVVSATLRVSGAGHAVPTGDMYRNLVFRVRAGEAIAEADMSRLFDRDEDGERVEIADQRVLPGIARQIELVLHAPRGPLQWSLTWNALSPSATRVEGIDESFRAREIASGVLRLPRTRR